MSSSDRHGRSRRPERAGEDTRTAPREGQHQLERPARAEEVPGAPRELAPVDRGDLRLAPPRLEKDAGSHRPQIGAGG